MCEWKSPSKGPVTDPKVIAFVQSPSKSTKQTAQQKACYDQQCTNSTQPFCILKAQISFFAKCNRPIWRSLLLIFLQCSFNYQR
jgi:hypothetical protein